MKITPLTPLLLLPALSIGCAGSGTALPPAPPQEDSVRPGINDRFLDEDLDVDEFVLTFEGESREIAIHREGIVAALQLQPGMAVADVGAGTGLFLKPLIRPVRPGGKLYAIDISPRFVEHLEERALMAGLTQVEVVLCSADSVRLPSASIDAALVCDTYHHFEYPRSTMTSLFQALRPGGRLLVVDFERIPGVSRDWTLEHVRAGKEVFRAEIESVGFRFEEEVEIDGLSENYVLRFTRP